MLIDLSLGILAGILTNLVFGGSDNSVLIVIFGALAAIATYLDIIIYKFWYGHRLDHFAHEHRDIAHYPVIICGLGSVIIAIFSVEFGLTWFLATLFHFVHNTLERGWGIKWLYPFWNKYITLKQDGPRPKIIMTKKEQQEIAAQYGDPDWMVKSLNLKRLLLEVTILGLLVLMAIFVIK